MFLIPTYVAASAIHGIGVYTPAYIAQGTRLWEFNPDVDWHLTPDELKHAPARLRTRLRSYCYLNRDGLYVLCGDNARFMNHADDPNCDDTSGRFTIARRDIRAGEELTCDYRTFDQEPASAGAGPLFVHPERA
jgi:uncharacterized protein